MIGPLRSFAKACLIFSKNSYFVIDILLGMFYTPAIGYKMIPKASGATKNP